MTAFCEGARVYLVTHVVVAPLEATVVATGGWRRHFLVLARTLPPFLPFDPSWPLARALPGLTAFPFPRRSFSFAATPVTLPPRRPRRGTTLTRRKTVPVVVLAPRSLRSTIAIAPIMTTTRIPPSGKNRLTVDRSQPHPAALAPLIARPPTDRRTWGRVIIARPTRRTRPLQPVGALLEAEAGMRRRTTICSATPTRTPLPPGCGSRKKF